jgi:mercuric ion transport protein
MSRLTASTRLMPLYGQQGRRSHLSSVEVLLHCRADSTLLVHWHTSARCLPNSQMTAAEMACCKKMAGDCNMRTGPHPCCKTVSNAPPSVPSIQTISQVHRCALPALLVLFGLGASVASTLSFMPWLVTLSRHKQWTFSISGILIALSFVNTYYISPHIRVKQCSPDNPSACEEAIKLSEVLLWVSAGIYGLGVFVAYVLVPILASLDNA